MRIENDKDWSGQDRIQHDSRGALNQKGMRRCHKYGISRSRPIQDFPLLNLHVVISLSFICFSSDYVYCGATPSSHFLLLLSSDPHNRFCGKSHRET
jgi:hypothetical protein